MKRFTDMSQIHNECKNERYSIKHIVYKPNFRDMFDMELRGQKDGDIITTLYDKEKREVVMSDSVMEKRTNIDFVERAKGDVLIGGLGIGMILLSIQDKEEVDSVTVVEIDQKLVDLVMIGLKDKLNDKVKICISDINKFETNQTYDTIYFDIWNDISGDNFLEMKSLYNKFKKNTSNNITQWRAVDTVALSDEEDRFSILDEDEAIQVVLKCIEEDDERAMEEYCETGFDEQKMYEEVDNNFFKCEYCGYWKDIGEQVETEDFDYICEDCI